MLGSTGSTGSFNGSSGSCTESTGELYWDHCTVLGTLRAVLGSTGKHRTELGSSGPYWEHWRAAR